MVVNNQLQQLERIQKNKAQILKDEEILSNEIRNNFVEGVVIFIDMVNSTQYKIQFSNSPEMWILRLNQFCAIIASFLEKNNAKVIKYIGDEVMGFFSQDSKIEDSLSVVSEINVIENTLSEVTGTEVKIKISLDFGKVYLLKYPGHDQCDPQGTPIDRCTRISKYCSPSTVLTSFEYVKMCSNPKLWSLIGNPNLKGLGETPIYQLGPATITIDSNSDNKDNQLLLNRQLETDKEEREKITSIFSSHHGGFDFNPYKAIHNYYINGNIIQLINYQNIIDVLYWDTGITAYKEYIKKSCTERAKDNYHVEYEYYCGKFGKNSINFEYIIQNMIDDDFIVLSNGKYELDSFGKDYLLKFLYYVFCPYREGIVFYESPL